MGCKFLPGFTYMTKSIQFSFSFQTIFSQRCKIHLVIFLHQFAFLALVHYQTFLSSESCWLGEVTRHFPQVNPVFVGNKCTPSLNLVQSYSHSFHKSILLHNNTCVRNKRSENKTGLFFCFVFTYIYTIPKNTANQNTGKHTIFDGIKPNHPIMHNIFQGKGIKQLCKGFSWYTMENRICHLFLCQKA